MVVLTLKNLQQQSFTVDIELSCTVKALKEKIELEKGSSYPANGQKIIYAGKILQDDNILESYNIDARKFLVIMVTKPKTAPPSDEPADPTVMEAPAAEEASDSTATTAATTTDTTSSTAETSSTSTSTSTTPTTESTANAESTIVMGDDFNKMVDNIVEMGYNRPQVERALRASFNNPYTAVQYLIDGIPSNLESPPDGEEPPVSAAQEGGLATAVPEGEDPLSFLRRQPLFNQMRQMIRSNPQLLDAFIQQIGQTNPELLQVIQQNQEAFIQMLNEPESSDSAVTGTGASTAVRTGSSSREPGQNSIMVSPQDRAAIERLRALGNFPEDVVIQAYFACEKNENLAAEFLFSQTWD